MKIVAYGEIMMRLSPQDYNQVADASTFDACYGGTESNVLVALSHLGNKTSFVSKVPNNPLGEGGSRRRTFINGRIYAWHLFLRTRIW